MAKLSESDLMVYYLAVEEGFYELMELYGLLHEYSKCPSCGHENGLHYKVMKELIDTFGDLGKPIKIPDKIMLTKVSRNITIWKGLSGLTNEEESARRLADYTERYELKKDSVYKIKYRMEVIVQKFLSLKKVFEA